MPIEVISRTRFATLVATAAGLLVGCGADETDVHSQHHAEQPDRDAATSSSESSNSVTR
jgi:hypothetical protein